MPCERHGRGCSGLRQSRLSAIRSRKQLLPQQLRCSGVGPAGTSLIEGWHGDTARVRRVRPRLEGPHRTLLKHTRIGINGTKSHWQTAWQHHTNLSTLGREARYDVGAWLRKAVRTEFSAWKCAARCGPSLLDMRIAHNYMGHTYLSHNYIGHNYMGITP